MALSKIQDVQLHYLNIWLSSLVDSINFDLQKIESAVPSLDKILNTVDTAPIQYLSDSFSELVNSLNDSFKQIESRLRKLEGEK